MLALFSALALACAACPAVAAAERVDFPSLDEELTHGEPTRLAGMLYRPEGAGPHPGIVGLHGCSGLFNRNGTVKLRDEAWAELLRARGYVVVLVDSFGVRGVSTVCGGAVSVRSSRERPYDAYAALDYLRSLPLVNAQRIGLVGWSHGGGALLYSIDAAARARARSPGAEFRAAVAFYPASCSVRAQRGGWSSGTQTLVLIGEKDDWTRAPPCTDFVDLAQRNGTQIEVVVYPDSYHDFDWPGLREHTLPLRGNPTVGSNPAAMADARQRVPAFFDRYLKD